jgi:ABC-2 type transport system permease protein
MVDHLEPGTRHAPSAFGDDLRRFVNLTVTLAVTEFKLRYFGSVLGYVWTLMRPLMLFGVLYLVFTHVVRFGGDVKNYPLYLLTSIVLWTYFAEATSGAVGSLVSRENLLRKIRFPRMVVPLSVVLTSLFNLGMNFLAVLVFALLSGVGPAWSWLEVPFLIAFLVLFATGLGMLLSALFVRYRDIQPIWDVALQLLFYGSPVIYVITALPDSVERELASNPIATVMTQMRHAFIDPTAPNAAEVIGSYARLLIPFGIVAAVFALGLWVFNREAPRIAENL